MKKSLLIQAMLAVAAASQARAAAPRPSAPAAGKRTCWHCKGEIHPLDVGHAARCSQVAHFQSKNALDQGQA